ncbi:MAG: virulence RhuM family protein [Acidobacteria bacterium]|nr:virulence RhuM family protein [Acidobacteriota bacterium]
MNSDHRPPAGEIILYQTADGTTRIECRFVEETLWLSQALIAQLFQKDVRTVNEHLLNIYAKEELDREATIRKFRIVRSEGSREVSREVDHYNLDAILAVGAVSGRRTSGVRAEVRSIRRRVAGLLISSDFRSWRSGVGFIDSDS